MLHYTYAWALSSDLPANATHAGDADKECTQHTEERHWYADCNDDNQRLSSQSIWRRRIVGHILKRKIAEMDITWHMHLSWECLSVCLYLHNGKCSEMLAGAVDPVTTPFSGAALRAPAPQATCTHDQMERGYKQWQETMQTCLQYVSVVYTTDNTGAGYYHR